MSKLSLFYPVCPLHFNQGFGVNPDYYSKFHDQFGNPYKGHDGIDFMAIHGQPVYAPMDGYATYSTDINKGQGVTISSTEPYEYINGVCWFQTLHWHLIGDTDSQYPKPFKGTKLVQAGDLIGYADNTGAPNESNGDHLHFGLKPCDQNFKLVNPGNGFNGAIDPTPYWNSYFAENATLVTNIYLKILELLKEIVGSRKP